MILIPAIDIRCGKCVMLTQGNIEKETIYSNDPVFMAKMWQAKGAQRLHVIDLDGAFCGVPQNWEIIKQIRSSFKGIIEFGGGVRNFETIKKITETGIDRVIIATMIIYHPELVRKAIKKFKSKIMAGIDIYNGKVAVGGWKEITEISALEIVKKLQDMGIKEIIVTDILKDGTLEGLNFDELKTIAASCSMNIFASGGVGSIEDVKKIKKLQKFGISGIIIGKALYNESIKFEDAIEILKEKKK
ncbi:MAG: 1-(5-phosphoribosyl)-5-[(5-phosphoribosylamino)methylideneamino]imidazole-4-carboxamide isomerase [Elusimicrobiota bacterium]